MVRAASRVFFGFGVSLALALASSCASNDVQPGDAGSDAPVIGPCGPGTATKCGDTCVDTQSDSQNCGACNAACSSDKVCSHGACAVVCGGGTARCGNDCVDTLADVNHCGDCNTKCPSGNVCNQGTCALTCQSGLTDCNGDCVDVTHNDDNCGACGSPCANGQVCVGSKCVATCQSGWTVCSVGDAGATTCVDTQHDKDHCGSCTTPCPSGEFCSPVNNVPTCGITCMGGTTLCSGACVDASLDPNHCGDCGTTCSSGNCSGGHCCGAGLVYCGACDTVTNCITNGSGRISGGSNHTCAIASTGTLKCWGDDFYGELGDDNAGSAALSPVDVLTLTNVTKVGAGDGFTCAVASGSGYCWGEPFGGELGDGDPDTELDAPSSALSLSASPTQIDGGLTQGCALLTGGAVECWGYNSTGNVGDGTTTERDSPVSVTLPKAAIAIDTGIGDTTCALLSDGTAMCWGANDDGQCGDGTTTFDDDLSPAAVQNLSGIATISLGSIHACALLTSGEVWCWGDDSYGELGDGGNQNNYSTVPVQAVGVSGALAIAAGSSHTCALLQSGAVICWGANYSGQLGDGTGNDSLTPVTALSSGAVGIAAGDSHTCALLASGKATCWGNNADGELGDGTGNDSLSPVQVQGF